MLPLDPLLAILRFRRHKGVVLIIGGVVAREHHCTRECVWCRVRAAEIGRVINAGSPVLGSQVGRTRRCSCTQGKVT